MPNSLSISPPSPPKPLTTQGDMIVMGPTEAQRLIAAADGLILTSKGVGVKPEYEELYSILTTKGDIIVRGDEAAQRLASSTLGHVLQSLGPEELPAWVKLPLKDIGVFHKFFTIQATASTEQRGIGFEPSLIIFFASDDTAGNMNYSIGVAINSDPILQWCLRIFSDGVSKNFTNVACSVYRDGSNHIKCTVTDFVADGFDADIVETGTVVADVRALCIG